MIEKYVPNTKIYNELDSDRQKFWFDLKRQKFLHNIDTFYYSATLDGNWTKETLDSKVLFFREFLEKEIAKAKDFEINQVTFSELDIPGKKGYVPKDFPTDIILYRSNFALYYNVCFSRPECFDIFVAHTVPNTEHATSQIVVQIRSKYLWLHGVNGAFKKSYEFLEQFTRMFGFKILEVHENRCDYCWHTNYIQNPDRFLLVDNIAKMRVSRMHEADFHVEFRGNEEYEIDYFRLGRLTSNRLLLRIYLKSKEVVEQGYKGWFFKLWLIHGLINRYDLYVYEKCYLKGNWDYLHKARLEYYLEHGSDDSLKHKCSAIIDDVYLLDHDDLVKFADSLTPKVTLILNVEYQTMRKFSNSIKLVPFKLNHGVCRRVFDYLDNRKLIIDYLTHDTCRFVRLDQEDTNKSRRDYHPFWAALRRCKLVDTPTVPDNLELVREYSNNIDKEKVKATALNAITTCQLYEKGMNNDSVFNDVSDFICTLNDNDLYKMKKFKNKKTQLLKNNLSNEPKQNESRFVLVDLATGSRIS